MLSITSPDLRNSYVVIICATLHKIHLRNSYVVIMCANSCQMLTISEIGSSQVDHCAVSLVPSIQSVICGHYICANACEKLTKSENVSS